MARKVCEIGDRIFSTQGAAEDFYRTILNDGQLGRVLNEQDFQFLLDLLALHPRYQEKCGSGVCMFTIETNQYGNRAFVLHRPDSSRENFSYLKCIRGDHKPFAEFSRACRRSVESRLHQWKAEKMDGRVVRCAISGEIVEFREAHVDHKPPQTFSVIAKAFAIAKEIDLQTVEYVRSGTEGVEFADRNLAAAFDEFHSRMAVIRIVRAEENLRASSGARVTPTSKDGTL